MIQLLYIDLFCGAGGTSTGVHSALLQGRQCAKVVACVNHDPNAIASHAANHPEALHFTEDIRTLDLTDLCQQLTIQKKRYPDAAVVLWASLECTNFSRAKGGKPRDADSRTLAEHLYRYIEAIEPDYIQIENVSEFMSWGDVNESGKPISKDRGRSYLNWVRNVRSYGYDFEYKILNSADFGAYTSRRRFFGIFSKEGLPIAWPEHTHCKDDAKRLFDTRPKWRPVKDVLDFNDEGNSIFDRKKPLCEKSLERIYAGLIRFVAGGKENFMRKQRELSRESNFLTLMVNSASDRPLAFLSKQFSGNPYEKNISIDGPAGTITTIDHHAFISVHYGNGYIQSCDAPSPTLTTKDKHSIIQPRFLVNEYSGGGQLSSIESPGPALLTNPKQKLITVSTQRNDLPSSVTYDSCGNMRIELKESDSNMTRKIKQFMALYGIVDILMRMFKIDELKRIQGFPADYILIGTKEEQKKYIGNAVECHVAAALCTALAMSYFDYRLALTYDNAV